MKKIIATEQIFSPMGHQIAVKYHYEDGSSRTITNEERVKRAKEAAKTVVDKWKKYRLIFNLDSFDRI